MTGVSANKPATQALESIEQACTDLMITVNQQVHNAEVSGCLRTPMPEDAPRTAAGSPLDRPVGPVAGA